ncbi:hypothetical protein K438DRAFT_2020820 [Mycena galopus ATCC 62051]|nr:hypothetical protein K438DRAFT_2025908 [Mycena galopus ATCC 62051]KAF8182797.1 hypothetical protein K438DRAFT_1975441 [Mycena galopus ATCC 62051]KAF8182820.1 hypothetical protein K438DRAFT_2020820 [Mycena galopus ATCC 62051]
MDIHAVHLELENQQRIEDAKTLRFTGSQEHRLPPLILFRSVKFQWSDLDGMRSVRRRHNARVHFNSFVPGNSPSLRSAIILPSISVPASAIPAALALTAESASLAAPEAFAVLTNARLASFVKDNANVIRVFRSALKQHFCATPTPYGSAPSYGAKYRVLVCTGHSRADRASGFLATRTHAPATFATLMRHVPSHR